MSYRSIIYFKFKMWFIILFFIYNILFRFSHIVLTVNLFYTSKLKNVLIFI